MYYYRNSELCPYPYPKTQPPKFPFWAVMGIIILAISISSGSKKEMDKMNAGNPDYIIFDETKKIVDASGISENDFIEIQSNKELKTKRKQLAKNEKAFIKFDGSIILTMKYPIINKWLIETSLGKSFTKDAPNGFVVYKPLLIDMFLNRNNIKARIFAVVPKSGKMSIYKIERIINDDKHNIKKQEASKFLSYFEGNRFLKIIMNYNTMFFIIIILTLLPFLIDSTKDRILLPLSLLHFFIVFSFLTFLLVIMQTVAYIHYHRFSIGFSIVQVLLILLVYQCITTVNLYKKIYYKQQENI